jgi:hypothetical protein
MALEVEHSTSLAVNKRDIKAIANAGGYYGVL